MGARFERTGAAPGAGARRLRDLGERVRVALASALQTLGPEMVASIRAEMARVQPGLHPFTVAQTGRARPLVGGALEAAVAFRVETTARGSYVWAGVPSGAGESGGVDLATLAAIHEYGVTIPVTDAMRGYLHAQGLHLKASTLAVVIPPRPFIGPGLRRFTGNGGRAREVVKESVARALRGR